MGVNQFGSPVEGGACRCSLTNETKVRIVSKGAQWESWSRAFEERTQVKASWSTRLNIERLNQGKPLIAADPNGWDDGYTLNPTAIYLERSLRNDEIISGLLGADTLDDPRLRHGVVAVLYRGVPQYKPGLPPLRSSVGLAVFTPQLEMIKRFPYPVIVP